MARIRNELGSWEISNATNTNTWSKTVGRTCIPAFIHFKEDFFKSCVSGETETNHVFLFLHAEVGRSTHTLLLA